MQNLTSNTQFNNQSFSDGLSLWGNLSAAAREYGAISLDTQPVTVIAETRRTFPRLVIDIYAGDGEYVETVYSVDDIPRPAVFDGKWLR